MSKKVVTINLTTGHHQLETIIDDKVAKGNTDVTYSGNFIDTQILSIAHDSHVLGSKTLDDTAIYDKFVIAYNLENDKLEYQNVDNLFNEIDCGYF